MQAQDCVVGTDCSEDTSTCGGVGASCTLNDDNVCQASLVCNTEMSDTCARPQPAGSGSCAEDADCQAPIQCAGNLCGGVGALCSNNNSTLCSALDGIVCNAATSTCSALQPVGGPCTEDQDCETGTGYDITSDLAQNS